MKDKKLTSLPKSTEEHTIPPFRMENPRKQAIWVSAVVLLVLVVDQCVKIWIKTHMALGDEIRVFDWFRILFVENIGMAFGVELGSKLFLSLFRIIAMGLIAWGIVVLVKSRHFPLGFLICMALVFSGGIGNVLDSMFYGMIFSDSNGQIATLFPPDGGYGSFLHGKVVDMLYFPLIDTVWPSWMPFVGGKRFTFFDPVFNIADSCISVGVVLLLVFYTRTFTEAVEYFSNPRIRKATKAINRERLGNTTKDENEQ